MVTYAESKGTGFPRPDDDRPLVPDNGSAASILHRIRHASDCDLANPKPVAQVNRVIPLAVKNPSAQQRICNIFPHIEEIYITKESLVDDSKKYPNNYQKPSST